MIKRLLSLAIVTIACMSIGGITSANAASCTTDQSATYKNAQGYSYFQAALYCSTPIGSNRVDKVQFSGACRPVCDGGYSAQWYDYVNGYILQTSTGGATYTVPANGAVYYNYYTSGWCNGGSTYVYEEWSFRIHQFATNSWGDWHQTVSPSEFAWC